MTKILIQPIHFTELSSDHDYDKHFVWVALQRVFGEFPIVLGERHRKELEALAGAHHALCVQRKQKDGKPFDYLLGAIHNYGSIQVRIDFREGKDE